MQFLSIVSTVINDGEAFISGNEPETFVGAAETAGSVASDFLDKFMNMDFIKECRCLCNRLCLCNSTHINYLWRFQGF